MTITVSAPKHLCLSLRKWRIQVKNSTLVTKHQLSRENLWRKQEQNVVAQRTHLHCTTGE